MRSGRSLLGIAAAGLLLLGAASAAARPHIVRGHKGLGGKWPGLGLLSDEIEAAAHLEVAPFARWLGQHDAREVDELVREVAGSLAGTRLDIKSDVVARTQSILLAVATRFGPHSDSFSMMVVLGGAYDSRLIERRLDEAYAEVHRQGSLRVYAEPGGGERRRAYAVVPGGIVWGPLPWVKHAVDHVASAGESRISQVIKARVPGRGAGTFAWAALSPTPETRRQLTPIKRFLGWFEGVTTMSLEAGNRTRIALRLDFRSAADAREARPFLQQILGLYSQLARRGVAGALVSVLSSLASGLTVDGSAVVADFKK